MKHNDLVVLVPAFNEEAEIESVISEISKFGFPLVIDDGSTDNTRKMAEGAGAKVLCHAGNMGYEAALETGFSYFVTSEFAYAITFDADGQHDPEMIEDFRAHLADGAACVLGVRERFQRISEYIFAFVAKIIWGIKDPLCGMKGYAKMSIPERIVDNFDSIGTKFAVNAVRDNLKVVQVPVTIRQREGTARFGAGIRPNLKILNALLSLLFSHRLKSYENSL